MDDSYKKLEDTEKRGEHKAILFHGFSPDELGRIIDHLRSMPDKPSDIMMAATTETNMKWNVEELISELTKDHEFFKEQAKKRAEQKK